MTTTKKAASATVDESRDNAILLDAVEKLLPKASFGELEFVYFFLLRTGENT